MVDCAGEAESRGWGESKLQPDQCACLAPHLPREGDCGGPEPGQDPKIAQADGTGPSTGEL